MGRQYKTPEALWQAGRLQQHLDALKSHDRNTANMINEFEEVFSPGEPDAFAPESTGTFTKEELAAAEAELAAEDGINTAFYEPKVDRYASRRGTQHWTRRRVAQGPTRKLLDSQAAYARKAYFLDKHRVVDIAATLHVTPSTVYGILSGRSHRRASAGWEAQA